jgi:hypothetical protein
MTNFPKFFRPSVEAPLDRPDQLFPLNELQALALFESGTLGPDAATLAPGKSKKYVAAALENVIIPVSRELDFMGLGQVQIRVEASWMPAQPDYVPVKSDVECTEGRVCISAFATFYTLICRAVNASTTAHRRYKDAFCGESIRIVIDADANAVRMRMHPDLVDAIQDSFNAWSNGR